jgi:hypothetical protein
MSVGNVNGFNGLSNKDLRKVEPPKEKAPKEGKASEKAKSTEKSRSKTEVSGQPATRPPEEVESQKTDSLSSLSDILELSMQEKESEDTQSFEDLVEQVQNPDSVEISWRDPEVVEKIHELIELIKSQKEEISRRIEAARILIMERAYDNNEELKNTAEAILRGENVDEFDPGQDPSVSA